jgi:hypothetical protein
VKNLAISVFGNDAYRILVSREEDLQDLVKGARQWIVVKSVVIPMANFLSNIYHLIARGVPITDIITKMPRKLAEIRAYTRGQVREVELEAKIRASRDMPRERSKLEAELQGSADIVLVSYLRS